MSDTKRFLQNAVELYFCMTLRLQDSMVQESSFRTLKTALVSDQESPLSIPKVERTPALESVSHFLNHPKLSADLGQISHKKRDARST